MNEDSFEAAQKAFGKFKDSRIKQFYDQDKLAGKAFARSLKHDGEVAWDFYMFYPVQSIWQELPPAPEIYFHQLRDSWANQTCLFEKNMLVAKLSETMELLFS